MDYDTWKTTDWGAEDAAYEEAMVEKYGEDWRDYLEDKKLEALLDNL